MVRTMIFAVAVLPACAANLPVSSSELPTSMHPTAPRVGQNNTAVRVALRDITVHVGVRPDLQSEAILQGLLAQSGSGLAWVPRVEAEMLVDVDVSAFVESRPSGWYVPSIAMSVGGLLANVGAGAAIAYATSGPSQPESGVSALLGAGVGTLAGLPVAILVPLALPITRIAVRYDARVTVRRAQDALEVDLRRVHDLARAHDVSVFSVSAVMRRSTPEALSQLAEQIRQAIAESAPTNGSSAPPTTP